MGKRILSILLVLTMVLGLFVGCGNKDVNSDDQTDQEVADKDNTEAEVTDSEDSDDKEKEEVVLWYLWTGVEGENLEKIVDEFNNNQDKYEVKGLSVPDVQKVTVAISSGEGPDITDDFSNNVASYAEKGIMEPLDKYIKDSGYDTSDFVPAALETCQYNDETYALPIGMNLMMLFYNKQLFKEAGIEEPPKTDEELLDCAIKLTKVNDDKSIDVLGFPDFPFVYYVNPMSFALGGQFASEDGKTLTPNNEGTIRALDILVEYREKFGLDNVIKFQSSGKYLDPTDPFISGKQAMRIDGPWLGHNIKNVIKADVDYGVVPLPYPEGKPELEKSAEVSSSMFYIPVTAKNKDGAWEFLSYICGGEGMKQFNLLNAGLPARLSLLEDSDFEALEDFEAFADLAKSPNLKTFPSLPQQAEYQQIIGDQAELAASLEKSPKEAMDEAAEKAKKLLEE